MNILRHVLLFLTFFISFNRVQSEVQVYPYYAAKCLALSTDCAKWIADASGSCLPQTQAYKQPLACKNFACNWCQEWTIRMNSYPCSSFPVRNNCPNLSNTNSPPSPSPTPSLSPTPSKSTMPTPQTGRCVWNGTGNHTTIDLGKVPLVKGWLPVTRWSPVRKENLNGIIFIDTPYKGISPKGYASMCFLVRAPQDGNYYFSAISYAPHNTEHNDAWVKSEYGFELWKHGVFRRKASNKEWLKAYQNYATRGLSDDLKTIDFDGHRFLIPGVQKNKTFEVCIAGRSTRYEMYRLLLVKCWGKYCQGKIMHHLINMNPSECVWGLDN